MHHNFKELKIWSEAISLVNTIYALVRLFPPEERYGIAQQMYRSAVSIPSNIAEGAGRESNKEFVRFLNIATGSSYELETQFIISQGQGYISEEQAKYCLKEIERLQKMIYNFKKTLQQQG